MNSGIYVIKHSESGKVYVGSAKNFVARWRVHKCLLNKGKHHSRYLQAAWDKYGARAFDFVVLLACDECNLIFYEQRAIDTFKAFDREHGFNARPKAESTLGIKLSDETREKIKAARARQVFTPELRARLSAIRLGKKMPDGFGAKARLWKLGSTHTPEAKQKISDANRNRTCSIATREKRGKLTQEQVEEIRLEYASGGILQRELAVRYGVDPSCISVIVTRKRWDLPPNGDH